MEKNGKVVLEAVRDGEALIWRKDTWGSYGQHDNIYSFFILQDLTTKAVFELVETRHVNNDSRKNKHRYTYAKIEDIKKVLETEAILLKKVHDYASSSKRVVNVEYYELDGEEIVLAEYETGLRDKKGFYDLVKLKDGRKLKIRKDEVEEVR